MNTLTRKEQIRRTAQRRKGLPGPRLEKKEAIKRIQAVCLALAKRGGVGAIQFRAVADESGFSRGTVGYYFGSVVGLLAATAKIGFDDLRAELSHVAQSTGDRDLVYVSEQQAAAHAAFALTNVGLYGAMHAPQMWEAALKSSPNFTNDHATSEWLKDASHARAHAFSEYVSAIWRAKKREKSQFALPADRIAHALTSLVDGYVFQVNHERVHSNFLIPQHLEYVSGLARLVAVGASNPTSKK